MPVPKLSNDLIRYRFKKSKNGINENCYILGNHNRRSQETRKTITYKAILKKSQRSQEEEKPALASMILSIRRAVFSGYYHLVYPQRGKELLLLGVGARNA
jgi:hypothetical protein